jgi:hypothetical protein
MKKSDKDSPEGVVIEDGFGSTNDLLDRDATIIQPAYYRAENRDLVIGARKLIHNIQRAIDAPAENLGNGAIAK